jgi:hypothetical protein
MKKSETDKIISRHAPGHIREEFLVLVDEDLFDNMSEIKRLHSLLGHCTFRLKANRRRFSETNQLKKEK